MTTTLEITRDERAMMIPLVRLEPSPDNPRSELTELEDLAASIRAVGVLQSLLVAPTDETNQTFRILAGHRRAAAAEMAGLEMVPAIIRREYAGDDSAQQIAMLTENLQRVDLTPLDRARGYERLTTLGLKQKEIGERTGVSQPTVSRTMTLLRLPEKAQLWVEEGGLGVGDAAKLWALPAEVRDEVIEHSEDAGDVLRELRDAERERQREETADAKRKELQEAGVVVLASPAEALDGKAKRLHELHWVKPAQHRKADCRAVTVSAGHREPQITEWCTKPKAHPKPKEKPAPGTGSKKADDELARHLEALAAANARRHEFMASHQPDLLPVLQRLVDAEDRKEVAEVLGIEMGELEAFADTVEKATRVLWLSEVLWQEQGCFETEGWGAPKAMSAFVLSERRQEEAQAVISSLMLAGYEASWVELKHVGLPYEESPVTLLSDPELTEELGAAHAGSGPTETGAAAPTPSSTGAEGAPGLQTGGEAPPVEPLTRVEPRGTKFVAICTEHGEIGTNTTEGYAQERIDKHLIDVEHAPADLAAVAS